jgi:glutamate carboxypeptidase
MVMNADIIATVDRLLVYAREHCGEVIAIVRQMVECESPSDDAAAVNRFVDLVGDTVSGTARVKTSAGGKFGRHLRENPRLALVS